MRFLAQVTIPKGEAGLETIQSAMQSLHPEAAYFIDHEETSECLFVFNLNIQKLLKPLFRDVDASLEVTPVMNAAEFQQGLGGEKERQPQATQSDFLDDISPVPSDAPGDRLPHRPDPAEEEMKKYYT